MNQPLGLNPGNSVRDVHQPFMARILARFPRDASGIHPTTAFAPHLICFASVFIPRPPLVGPRITNLDFRGPIVPTGR